MDDFAKLRAVSPKRQVCSSSLLKKANGPGGALAFLTPKFEETFSVVSPRSLKRRSGRYGDFFSYTVKEQSDYDEIHSWLTEHAGTVFIRSLMDSALALGLHQSEPGVRTEIGELEYQAKSQNSAAAREEIARRLTDRIGSLLGFGRIDAICSVPPSIPGTQGLPNFAAARVAEHSGLPDLTSLLNWQSPKPSIKEIRVEDKWAVLERVGLTVGDGIADKNIVLIDDLYQSGTTAHFVASKLFSAGASNVHCFAIVKALSDKDNS